MRFTVEHEWVKPESGNQYKVGITDHAATELGDIVFIELPEVDAEVDSGDEIAVIESVKAASELYSPLSGKVVAINRELENTPELPNQDPYGKGWFFTIEASDSTQYDKLMTQDQYQELVE